MTQAVLEGRLKLTWLDPPSDVVLEQGGMHVMLMGLTGSVTEGDMVPATLIFEQAGRVAVEFMVDPPNGVDHSKMNHGSDGGDDPHAGHSN